MFQSQTAKTQSRLSIVNVAKGIMTADVAVPGRTRWAVFDPEIERFDVNIADPSEIAILDAKDPDGLVGSYKIPAAGRHGIELDPRGGGLFCACGVCRPFERDALSGKM